MDKKQKENALARIRIVEAILREWDPIGVLPDEGGPKDEYDSYAPHIVSMVLSNCSLDQLTAHLSHLRTGAMGMPDNGASDRRSAEKIIRLLRKQHLSL